MTEDEKVATTRSRQRKLARDRYERQMVRRAQHQRLRRQIQAGVGAFVVLALVVAGAAWLGGWFTSDPDPEQAAGPDRCLWQPLDATALPERFDVGMPDANPPESGTRTMTASLAAGTGDGVVEVTIDVAADPCAAASMEFLATQGFFDGTECHEITDGAALRCGDPGGSGVGGPTYAFFGANLPGNLGDAPPTNGDGTPVAYPRGTVALADDTGYNSSQFLIFFEDYATDQPFWPIIGQVTAGLDVVGAIGAAGTAEDSSAPAAPVTLRAVTVTDPDADGGSVDES
jgi:peptidyl-prolyl cis-trans isomerase B (cyclophilin B)